MIFLIWKIQKIFKNTQYDISRQVIYNDCEKKMIGK